MGDIKTDDLSKGDGSGESRLRGATGVDESARRQSENTDQVLRTDGEEHTLYDDGLELENGSRPLKGINGKDDT